MIGAIVPRPIAFVSTLSRDGVRNLAPFSFFTGVSARPPIICFCPMRRDGANPRKDTLANISATREFVVNVVSEEFAEQMNMTSGEYPPEVDEFELSGLTPIPSDLVKPPRVAECPVHLEAVLTARHPLAEHDPSRQGKLVALEVRVVRVFVSEELRIEGEANRIDPTKWRPLIMSFTHFFGLGPRVYPSTLSQIPEHIYHPRGARAVPAAAYTSHRRAGE